MSRINMMTKSKTNIGGVKLDIWKSPHGRSIRYTLQDGFDVIGEISLLVGYAYNNPSDIELYVNYVENNYHKTRDKMAYLCGFYIHDGFRKKGYGKSLLRHVLNEFKGYMLLLHAQPMGGNDTLDKESLYKFYQSMGFNFIPFDSKFVPLMGNNND